MLSLDLGVSYIFRIHVSTDNKQFVTHWKKWKAVHFPILLDVQYFQRFSASGGFASWPPGPWPGALSPDPRYRLAFHALAIKCAVGIWVILGNVYTLVTHSEPFLDYLTKYDSNIHSNNTRTKDNLHLNHSCTTSRLRSVRHKAAVLWNDLPLSRQQTESLLVFKNHLRCHLLSSISILSI